MFFSLILAASTGMLSGDYRFTSPITNNIEGRVMSESRDYRLIRYEDVAWLEEAFAERERMAATYETDETNSVALLIGSGFPVMRVAGGYVDNSVSDYCPVAFGGSADYLTMAGFTNFAGTANCPSTGGLISSSWLVSNFVAAAGMSRLLVPVSANWSATGPWSYDLGFYGYTYDYFTEERPQFRLDTDRRQGTNSTAFYLARKHVMASATSFDYAQRRNSLEPTDGWTWTSFSYGESRFVDEGKTTAASMTIFHPCDTNAWLRGDDTPAARVRNVAAWGQVTVYNSHNGSISYTNVFLPLGEPRFASVATAERGLKWEIPTLDIAAIASLACATGEMHDATWVDSATVPWPSAPPGHGGEPIIAHGVQDGLWVPDHAGLWTETNTTNEQRFVQLNLGQVYLVFDLRLTTWLSQWNR